MGNRISGHLYFLKIESTAMKPRTAGSKFPLWNALCLDLDLIRFICKYTELPLYYCDICLFSKMYQYLHGGKENNLTSMLWLFKQFLVPIDCWRSPLPPLQSEQDEMGTDESIKGADVVFSMWDAHVLTANMVKNVLGKLILRVLMLFWERCYLLSTLLPLLSLKSYSHLLIQ